MSTPTNTLGTLASAVIIQRALALVNTKRPLLKHISTDLSDDAVKYGQSVISRLKSLPSVQNFGSGPSATTTTDVPVTINQFKEIHVAFSAQDLSSTDRNLIDEQAEPIATAFANYVVDAIAALYTPTNFTNKTVVASGWTRANTVVPLRGALVGRGVPGDLFASLNESVYSSLLVDPMIVSVLNNRDQDTIKSGVITPVDGFGLSEYPLLPTANNLVGFAGAADATVIATRLPRDPREVLPNAPFPGNLGIVKDPTTGLSVMVREYIDPVDLSAHAAICWMMGVAVGNANNGQLLTTA